MTKRMVWPALAAVLALGGAACEDKKDADELRRDAKQVVPGRQGAEETAEDAKEAVQNAGKDVKEAAKETRDDVKRQGRRAQDESRSERQ